MARSSVIVVTLAVLAALGGLAYVRVSRTVADESHEPRTNAAVPRAAATPMGAVTNLVAVDEPQQAPAPPSSPPPYTTGEVAQWILDSWSDDAKTRAAAIAALANAPKAQAVPALERVLESGEPQVDRQIALQSLHTLALSSGDDDGKIRDAIRHAMYHSDDEGVTQSAQAVLEDIDAEFTQRARSD